MIRTCCAIFTVASACLFTLVGCASNGILGVDQCATVQSGAIPEPAGNKLCNWETAQAVSALADQLAFYRSDFIGDTVELSPSATERIGRLARYTENETSSLPWIVEPTGDPSLDQARLDNVAFQLESHGFPPVNVTLATPAAIGLSGPQAERVAGAVGVNSSNAGQGNANGGALTNGGAGNGIGFTGGTFN